MKRFIKLVLISAMLIGFFNACGTVRVPIQITKPAEINMSEYKQVAIHGIYGTLGNDFSDRIKTALVENPRFDVVERSRLNQILRELRLSSSDLSDKRNLTKIGKLMTASALISGRFNGKFKQKYERKKQKCGSKEKGYYKCVNFIRKGTYTAEGTIDVVDIATGKIISSKRLSASRSKSNSAIGKWPSAVDSSSLKQACLKECTDSFLKSIIPWTETVYAAFKKDDALPALEEGIKYAQIGDMEQAVKIFGRATKLAESEPLIKPETKAAAYWNLGLAYEYSEQFKNAVKAFQKGYLLDPNAKYQTEIMNVRKLEENKKKLKEQGV